MSRVRLEIDEVTIYRAKKRWNLYFLVLIEHPEEPEKMLISTLPSKPFKLSSRHNNQYQFDTDEKGSEGLFLFSRELPKNRELNVHIYLRHTRKKSRDLGTLLQDIEQEIVGNTFGIITDIVGATTVPWLVISKKVVPLIGKILKKLPDRDFGFLSAFERFGEEFEQQYEIDRKKDFTGDASLVYSWSIDE